MFDYCADLILGEDLNDRADSDQSCSRDWRNAGPAWQAVRSKNECLERECVLWPSGRYRMWESSQNSGIGKDSRKHVISWVPDKRALRGYSQPFFCAHHGTSAIHRKESYETGASFLYVWETSSRYLLSTAWEGTVQPLQCKGGSLKWTQTQCWGGWAVKDCHLLKRKLGSGAPDASRKRRTPVTEPASISTSRPHPQNMAPRVPHGALCGKPEPCA